VKLGEGNKGREMLSKFLRGKTSKPERLSPSEGGETGISRGRLENAQK
jgi:hypothetical protein